MIEPAEIAALVNAMALTPIDRTDAHFRILCATADSIILLVILFFTILPPVDVGIWLVGCDRRNLGILPNILPFG